MEEAYATAQKETANSIKEVEKHLQNIDSKLDLINRIINLKTDQLASNVQSIINTLSSSDERSKYNWALDHANYGSFFYLVKNEKGKRTSSCLIKEVMISFRKGNGHYLPQNARQFKHDINATKTDQTAFETRLVNAIFDLTGEKPVIKDVDHERYIFKDKFHE